MGDQDDQAGKRTGWDTDPTADYPVGPGDAGNAVMHGIRLLVGVRSPRVLGRDACPARVASVAVARPAEHRRAPQ